MTAAVIAYALDRARRQNVAGIGADPVPPPGPLARLAKRYWWTVPLTAAAAYASYRMRGKTHAMGMVLDVTVVAGAMASIIAIIELEASKPSA